MLVYRNANVLVGPLIGLHLNRRLGLLFFIIGLNNDAPFMN